jgi:hypothetical protein
MAAVGYPLITSYKCRVGYGTLSLEFTINKFLKQAYHACLPACLPACLSACPHVYWHQ